MVDNMKKNIFKKIMAFSLVEVLLSMAILSIFIVGTMKVITVKPAARKIEYPHGYFECYYDNGNLRYRHYFGNSLKNKGDNVSFCTFEPPTGAAFLNIHVVSPRCEEVMWDADLNSWIIGPGQSLVHAETQPYANNILRITPQLGARYAKIESLDDNGNVENPNIYTTSLQNISEETLLQHMKIVTQNTTRPEMHDKLKNNTLGCEGTGMGRYGAVLISW